MEIKPKPNEENALKYVGPTSLKDIETRLLEIEHEKPMRIHNAKENYSGSMVDDIEFDDIAYLDVEKSQLQLRRQFILDKRGDWKPKIIWDVLVPIMVAVATTYIVATFISGT